MNLVHFQADSRSAFTAFLRSKPNVCAGKAIDLIKAGRPVAELRELLIEPCAAWFYSRCTSRPRSAMIKHSLVDACANGAGELTAVPAVRDGMVCTEIGPCDRIGGLTEENQNRVASLRFLLDSGFPEGTNGWRGDLFPFAIAQAL